MIDRGSTVLWIKTSLVFLGYMITLQFFKLLTGYVDDQTYHFLYNLKLIIKLYAYGIHMKYI